MIMTASVQNAHLNNENRCDDALDEELVVAPKSMYLCT